MGKHSSTTCEGDSFEHEEAKKAREELEDLYSEKGEEGIQTRRETLVRRQEEGRTEMEAWKERRDAARRAFRSAERLAEKYGLDARCEETHFVGSYLWANSPSRYRTEAPSEDVPAHWRVEESNQGDKVLVAVTEPGEDTGEYIFQIPLEVTFEELCERAKDEWRRLRGKYLEAQEREKKREIWLEVTREVEDKIGFGSVGSERDEDGTERQGSPLDGWQKNAAKMYACFHEHGAPDYLSDVDDAVEDAGGLDSFSYEHTWKILKREGWARSEGNTEALVDALERWAAQFEDEYGVRRADWAAKPFGWPKGDE